MNVSDKIHAYENLLKPLETISQLSLGQKLSVHATTKDLALSITNTHTWVGYVVQPFERGIGQKIGSYDQNWRAIVQRINQLIIDINILVESGLFSTKELATLKDKMLNASYKIKTMAETSYANKHDAQTEFKKIAVQLDSLAGNMITFISA